jgi:prepilin-type processing-associated H-X9-DG protein
MYQLVRAGGLYVMNHNLWVYRTVPGFITKIPDPIMAITGTDLAVYGPLQKSTDAGRAFIPIISDTCFSGYGTTVSVNVKDINITAANNFAAAKKYSGHVYAGQLIGVNMVFVDGHVAQHNKSQIAGVWLNSGNAGWYY